MLYRSKTLRVFMSRNDHRNLLRDAVADHVPYPGSPEIVEQQPFVFPFVAARLTLHYRNDLAALLAHKLASSSNNTRLPPSIPEISNRLAIITSEDEILGNLSYGAGDNQLVKLSTVRRFPRQAFSGTPRSCRAPASNYFLTNLSDRRPLPLGRCAIAGTSESSCEQANRQPELGYSSCRPRAPVFLPTAPNLDCIPCSRPPIFEADPLCCARHNST